MYCKKTIFLSVLLLITMLIFSCASKKDDSHGHDHDDAEGENVWKEIDDFHMIMAESFHPYKDSSNLEPAKAMAAELMTAADAWASSSLPAKVDNADMRSKLEKLKKEATSLAESVKSADENVIGDQLTRLHDTYHEIQDTWYGGH